MICHEIYYIIKHCTSNTCSHSSKLQSIHTNSCIRFTSKYPSILSQPRRPLICIRSRCCCVYLVIVCPDGRCVYLVLVCVFIWWLCVRMAVAVVFIWWLCVRMAVVCIWWLCVRMAVAVVFIWWLCVRMAAAVVFIWWLCVRMAVADVCIWWLCVRMAVGMKDWRYRVVLRRRILNLSIRLYVSCQIQVWMGASRQPNSSSVCLLLLSPHYPTCLLMFLLSLFLSCLDAFPPQQVIPKVKTLLMVDVQNIRNISLWASELSQAFLTTASTRHF